MPEARVHISVTVMVFTLNEELNLPACLNSLDWCDDVIVVDSFSTDRTQQIAEGAGARFFQHEFTGFGDQRNWALDNTEPRYEWILMLDADERVTQELAEDIRNVVDSSSKDIGAYRVARRLHFWGRWLRHSSLYPTYVVRLVRRGRVRYVNRGHAETQEIDGKIGELPNDLIDENKKGLTEWFQRQIRYAREEAEYELINSSSRFMLRDLIDSDPLVRRTAMKRISWSFPLRPLCYFFYAYFWRRGFLDGRRGLAFCSMKAIYYGMVNIYKYDFKQTNTVIRK